jgi:hypothetical protein
MFNVNNRHVPLFSISELNNFLKVVEIVFNYELLKYKNLLKIDLSLSININKVNSQILLATDKNWKLNANDYIKYNRSSKLLDNTTEAISKVFKTKSKPIKPSSKSNQLNLKSSNCKYLYDLRGINKIVELPLGNSLYICDAEKPPVDFSSYTAVNSDILIEYNLNKFKHKKTNVNFAIGIVKI